MSHIEAFKEEHAAVTALMTAIRRAGVHTMEGRSLLMASRDRILKHLQKGVDELYPDLKHAAASDPALNSILGSFEAELKEISQFCSNFFEKYEFGGGGIDFFKDFEQLTSTLESRMAEMEIET